MTLCLPPLTQKLLAPTVRLKNQQSRLCALRRQYLEGDYLPRAVVQDFVIALASDFKAKVLQLPPRLRRIIPGPPNFELEDAFEGIIDQFLREIAETSLIVPEPERFKGAYTSKPGPKPKRANGTVLKPLTPLSGCRPDLEREKK